MLRERAVGESLWEAVLPAELRELPAELGKVDAILDEDRFLAPFRSRLTAPTGRFGPVRARGVAADTAGAAGQGGGSCAAESSARSAPLGRQAGAGDLGRACLRRAWARDDRPIDRGDRHPGEADGARGARAR